MPELLDALIVGAGPAGSACAARLAGNGWAVTAVDRAVPGRSRVCGGFLGPEFADWARSWGWEKEFEKLNKWPVSRVLVTGGPKSRATEAIDAPHAAQPVGYRQAYAVDRGRLDAWVAQLAQSRGAQLIFSEEVIDLKRADGIWSGRLSVSGQMLRARTLIVAHGRRNVPTTEKKPPFFACRTVYRDVAELDGTVALHFVPKGHVGLNPMGNGEATMCLCVDGSYLRDSRGNLDIMMERLMVANPHILRHLAFAQRTAEWTNCQAQPDGRKIFFEGGRFFAGDAVSMISPVIGGGIPIAMQSGVLLADVLADTRTRGGGEVEAARVYERAWRDAFDKKFTFGDWLGIAERSDWGSRILVGAMERIPGLLNRFVKLSRPTPA